MTPHNAVRKGGHMAKSGKAREVKKVEIVYCDE
jgi:hypothetical protein